MPLLQEEAKERMLAGKRIDPMPKTAQGHTGSDFNNIQKGSARDIVARGSIYFCLAEVSEISICVGVLMTAV